MAAVRRPADTCLSCGGDVAPADAVCDVCGEPTRPPERKVLTLLFADLAGYTEMCSRLDPEQVFEVMRPAMTSLRRVVESFGGTVPHIAGDGFMAVFGAPAAHEDDAERAVRAADALQRRVRSINDKSRVPLPELRVGVETGEVLVAASREVAGFSVSGSTVNLAARLCDLAAPGRCLVGPQAVALTAGAISFGGARRRRVKGLAEPVVVREVLGLRAEPRRHAQPRQPSRFVNRVEELAELMAAAAAAERTGRSAAVLLAGDAGQGKSRLAAEFAAGSSATVLTGRTSSYGERLPLSALADAVAGHLGVTAPLAGPEAAAAVAAAVDRLGVPDPARVTSGVLRMLGGDEQRGRGAAGGEVDAVRVVVESLAERGPVVIVLDDLHWADPELLDLIREVAAGAWSGPILVLGLGRPEVDLAGVRRLHLSVLAPSVMSTLLCDLAGGELPAAAAGQLLARAGGNPLFLEECALLLAEGGALHAGADGHVLVDPAALRAIPSSMRMFVAARLDALPPAEKAAVQHAAVLGERVWDGALPTESAAVVPDLVERGLLREMRPSLVPGTTEYTFTHDLIREAAYESVAHRTRARMHAAVADWLLEVEARSDAFRAPASLLAHHYHQAFQHTRGQVGGPDDCAVARAAVHHLTRWANELYASRARPAEVAYASAIDVARAAPQCIARPVRAQLHVAHARACVELGRYAEADADAVRARSLTTVADDPQVHAAAGLVLVQTMQYQSRFDDVADLLVQLEPLVARAGSPELTAQLALERARVSRFADYPRLPWLLREAYAACVAADDVIGQYEMAHELALVQTMEGGADHVRWSAAARGLTSPDDVRGLARLERSAALVALHRGDHVVAAERARAAARLAIEGGFKIVEADAMLCLIAAGAATGEIDGGEETLAGLLELSERQGWVRMPALAHAAGARLALRRRDAAAAEQRLTRSRELFDRTPAVFERLDLDIAAVAVLVDAGRWDDVDGPTSVVLEALEPCGWGLYAMATQVAAARAALGRLAPDCVGRLAEAIEAARRHDAPAWAAEASVCLEQAQLLRREPASSRIESPSDSVLVRAVAAENSGIRSWLAGEPVEAARWFAAAVDEWDRLGTTAWSARALAWQASAARRAGEVAAAEDLIAVATALAADVGAPGDLVERSGSVLLGTLG